MLIVIMEICHKFLHLLEREPFAVMGKDFSAVHVVDVRPHGLERDTSLTVVVDNFSDLEGISIAVTTLMKLYNNINTMHDFKVK